MPVIKEEEKKEEQQIDIDEIIRIGNALEEMQQTTGWKILYDLIKKQAEQHQLMLINAKLEEVPKIQGIIKALIWVVTIIEEKIQESQKYKEEQQK